MTIVYLYGCRTPGTGGFDWRLTRAEANVMRRSDLVMGGQCTPVVRAIIPRVKPEAITNYIDRHLPDLWDRDWEEKQ